MLLLASLLACSSPSPSPSSMTCAAATAAPHAAAPTSAPRPASAPPPPAEEGCLPDRGLGLTYEIYVRSFQDSNADGIGDLEGVRLRLDHLESLGVESLWLMPVFESPGKAGYDVSDYDRVQDVYGDEEDLQRLVDDAHTRGMRVLLDIPINHVARTHPWFAPAEADADARERDQFLFSDTQWDTYRWFPAEGGGWYYAFFGAELPDLDWSDATTRARMFEVFRGWLDVVDGYRLDAVITLVEADGRITGTDDTHALLADLYAAARDANPDAVLLAEASEPGGSENVAYLGSAAAPESDRVLDFPRRDALLAALAEGGPEPLLAHLVEMEDLGALGRTAPFLQSHDLSRLPAYVADARARRLLQVLQLTLPGDPVLYYGEELDLADATSATGQDYAWRAPIPWDATNNGGFTEAAIPWFTLDPLYASGRNVAEASADPGSVLNLLRGLACVREELDGADWRPLTTDAGSVFAYSRGTADGRVVVVANLSAEAVGEVRIDVVGGFRELTTDTGVDAGEGLRVRGIPAFGYRIYGDEMGGGCAVPGP